MSPGGVLALEAHSSHLTMALTRRRGCPGPYHRSRPATAPDQRPQPRLGLNRLAGGHPTSPLHPPSAIQSSSGQRRSRHSSMAIRTRKASPSPATGPTSLACPMRAVLLPWFPRGPASRQPPPKSRSEDAQSLRESSGALVIVSAPRPESAGPQPRAISSSSSSMPNLPCRTAPTTRLGILKVPRRGARALYRTCVLGLLAT